MASCTKLLTSICCLQLWEQGLVQIDDSVEEILPELVNLDIVSLVPSANSASGGLGAAEELKIEKPKTKITLRHLLTHTSGLPYEFTGTMPQVAAWREQHPEVKQVAGTVTQWYNPPLIFEPGTRWQYSPGIDWAGQLVERVNKQKLTLGEYMKEHIFGKLGPEAGKSTTFRLHSPEAKEAKIKERMLANAKRLPEEDGGGFLEESYGFEENVTEDSGGAGLYSTITDYTTVLADLIAPEPKLLKKETVDRWLFSPCIALDNHAALLDIINARTNMTPEGDKEVADSGINHTLGGLFWTKDAEVLPAGTLTCKSQDLL